MRKKEKSLFFGFIFQNKWDPSKRKQGNIDIFFNSTVPLIIWPHKAKFWNIKKNIKSEIVDKVVKKILIGQTIL